MLNKKFSFLKMVIKLPIIVVLVVFILSCKASKPTISADTNDLQRNISEIIKLNFSTNDSVQIIPNKDRTYYLLLSETIITSATPTCNIKFLVLNPLNQEIIYKNEYSNSLIKWFDNSQLLLTQFFGIVDQLTDKSKQYFIINLKTKEIKEVNSEIINNL